MTLTDKYLRIYLHYIYTHTRYGIMAPLRHPYSTLKGLGLEPKSQDLASFRLRQVVTADQAMSSPPDFLVCHYLAIYIYTYSNINTKTNMNRSMNASIHNPSIGVIWGAPPTQNKECDSQIVASTFLGPPRSSCNSNSIGKSNSRSKSNSNSNLKHQLLLQKYFPLMWYLF